MAIHDHERRSMHDHIRDARASYSSDEGAGVKTVGFIIGIALIGFILYMLFAASSGPRTTSDAVRQTPQNPTTTTAPRTNPTPSGPTTQPQ
jgi:hypothetical protein